MQALEETPLLFFHSNTLQEVRKTWGFDKSGDLDEVIDTFETWIKKQEHFTNKEFDRSYLERMIIMHKGSAEKAKLCLDKILSARTHFSEFFGNFTRAELISEHLIDSALPRLTKENYRVCIIDVTAAKLDRKELMNYFRKLIYMVEYCLKYDYCNGFVCIQDYRNAKLMELLKSYDMVLLTRATNLVLKRYGIKLMSLHFVYPSKLIHAVVNIAKQLVSKKVASRLHAHEDIESIYDWVDKDLLPSEYGGKERLLRDIYKHWLDVLTSEDFKEYINKINEYKIDESLRPQSEDNDELDMQGTFRNLTVD